ncbi:ABSCISIC ACID-INSENSITIVE 5-like protein 2 isoform X2 [Tasmannia lanceolata]|uniref:ABSCISIC ACID-INSENSITIVE 5-like protein 2 isoform X2 n=1 Tax=Tasmannia lanceolata TaxID=3420 RepID=UPI0040649023
MGIQTMGSEGGRHQSQFQTLSRQGSLYNLTLDEVQNQLGDLGKPLSSMNLDELLRNVWSAEANMGMGMDAESASQFASVSGLQHQDSVNLNRTLSKKTVDEVWKDIQQGQNNNNEAIKNRDRQPTLGEMTLEDFLAKAGVVSEASEKKRRGEEDLNNLDISQGIGNVGSVLGVDSMVGSQNFPQQQQWLQYQLPSLHQEQQQTQHHQQNMMNAYMSGHSMPQTLSVSASPLLDAAYSENQMPMSSPDTQTAGYKRVAPGGVVEKTVERKQKRMIKNRESAARSRARKQAYTNELEIKVNRLEEENERLKKKEVGISSFPEKFFL